MAKTVWKFPWPLPRDRAVLEMPEGAELLHVAAQHGTLAIWARVDPGAPKQARQFALCGTGHAAPEESDGRYVGTALLNDGTLVLHVFEFTGLLQ